MIIIEGCDNSGKTILCQKLSKMLKVPIEKSFIPKTMADAISQLMMSRVIKDRAFPISELVYGPVIRGKISPFTSRGLNILVSNKVPIIYCRPPTEKILDNRGRDQMDGVLDHHLELITRYDSLMDTLKNKLNLNILEYDYTVHSHNWEVEKFAKDRMDEITYRLSEMILMENMLCQS